MESEQNKILLTQSLCKFIIEKKIPIITKKDIFYQNFGLYVAEKGLKGMKEMLEVFHITLEHEDIQIKLDCKNNHCLACYFYFTMDYFFGENCTCTCGIRISPKLRNLIIKKNESVQSMRRACEICRKTKDLMNFCCYSLHSCLVCTGCIEESFQFEKADNKCRLCQVVYDEECIMSIRSLVAEKQDPDVVKRVFSVKCLRCGQDRDMRGFIQICENGHICCSECLVDINEDKETRCYVCKDKDISVFEGFRAFKRK